MSSRPPLLTENEVAEHLRVSPRTVRKYRHNGDLPHVRLGRSVRYLVDDVNAFISNLTVSNDAASPTRSTKRSVRRAAPKVVPFSQRQSR